MTKKVTSLPAMNSDGSDAGPLNSLDQTERLLQLNPVKKT